MEPTKPRSTWCCEAMTRGLLNKLIAAAVVAAALAGCSEPDFTDAEKRTIASMSLSALAAAASPTRPTASPTIRVLPPSARRCSSIPALSGDGNVACGTCHKIDRQFQDDLPRGVGVGETNRRTMPLAGVARDPFLFWDGRRDSLWSQALVPLENPLEHAGNAHRLCPLSQAPLRRALRAHLRSAARPVRPAGKRGSVRHAGRAGRLGGDDRRAAARHRPDILRHRQGASPPSSVRSRHGETRFDRFAKAVATGAAPSDDAMLSDEEKLGLKLFIGKANCSTCHTGPRFTDSHFHNTGVPPVDEIACGSRAGRGGGGGAGRSVQLFRAVPRRRRQGLRRASFHAEDIAGTGARLQDAVAARRGRPRRPTCMPASSPRWKMSSVTTPRRRPASRATSEIHPVALSERERAALVAFLKTLSE